MPLKPETDRRDTHTQTNTRFWGGGGGGIKPSEARNHRVQQQPQ